MDGEVDRGREGVSSSPVGDGGGRHGPGGSVIVAAVIGVVVIAPGTSAKAGDERPHEHAEDDEVADEGHGSTDEPRDVSAALLQGPPQVPLEERAEDGA